MNIKITMYQRSLMIQLVAENIKRVEEDVIAAKDVAEGFIPLLETHLDSARELLKNLKSLEQ